MMRPAGSCCAPRNGGLLKVQERKALSWYQLSDNISRASCERRLSRGIKAQVGKHHAAWIEIVRNCHIRVGNMLGLDAGLMRGAGIRAESRRAGGERVEGHGDRDLDAR